MPVEWRQSTLVEDLGHEAHVLGDGDGLPVAGRDPGRFLAPVLERVQAQVGQVRDRLSGRVDAEHAARVAGAGAVRSGFHPVPVSHEAPEILALVGAT